MLLRPRRSFRHLVLFKKTQCCYRQWPKPLFRRPLFNLQTLGPLEFAGLLWSTEFYTEIVCNNRQPSPSSFNLLFSFILCSLLFHFIVHFSPPALEEPSVPSQSIYMIASLHALKGLPPLLFKSILKSQALPYPQVR